MCTACFVSFQHVLNVHNGLFIKCRHLLCVVLLDLPVVPEWRCKGPFSICFSLIEFPHDLKADHLWGNLSCQSTDAGYFSNLTQIKLRSLLQAEAPYIPICVTLRTYVILSACFPSLCSPLHSFTYPICYLVIKDVPLCFVPPPVHPQLIHCQQSINYSSSDSFCFPEK